MKKWIFAAIALAIVLFPISAFADGALYLAKGGGEFPLKRTDISARVTGSVISTTVAQTFTNANKDRIEAVYVFPLPERAAVDDMEMKIGSRVIKAQLAKHAEAKTAYENAVRSGQHAALLEQERPNVFTFSVGNIAPGTDVQVRLHYFEEARFDAGTYEMAIPTTVGPRYNPTSVTDANRVSTPYAKRTGATIGIQARLAPLLARHVRLDAWITRRTRRKKCTRVGAARAAMRPPHPAHGRSRCSRSSSCAGAVRARSDRARLF